MKPGAKVPKKDVVLFVIKEVIQKHRDIASLREFTDLVNLRLKMVDSKLSVSGKRLRNIFIKMPGTKIVIETRRGKKIERCPSCSSGLKKVYTKNLRGKKILYKMICHRCCYAGVNGRFSPKRYRFIRM
jgi:ribosomal protein L34E